MRINSNDPGASVDDTGSKKGDDLELQVRDQYTPSDGEPVGGGGGDAAAGRSRRKFQFPRLGLDALIRDGRPEDNGIQDGSVVFYKVYKRRWFGLVELTLLSLLVSWEVSLTLILSYPILISKLSLVPSHPHTLRNGFAPSHGVGLVVCIPNFVQNHKFCGRKQKGLC